MRKSTGDIVQIISFEEIRKIVHEFDKVFNPPLSDRVSNLDYYANKLYKNAYIYAFMQDNKYLGFIAFYANDTTKVAYLTQIGVIPSQQNKRIGKLLLDKYNYISKQLGMIMLKLEVNKFNVKAINFYKNDGFEFCNETSTDSVYMLKKL